MPRTTTRYCSPKTRQNVSPSKLSRLGKDAQEQVLRRWFDVRFMDPNELPYDSGEGGYQWIWGEPVDPKDALQEEFSGLVSDELIETVADDFSELNHEWSPRPEEDDFYKDDWVPDDLDGPYMEFMMALNQIELVAKEKRSIIDGPLIYRLLYLNIIIALETYLGDSFSAVVFKQRPYLERFVHNSSHLREKQVSLSDVFKRAKTIETDVRGFVGGISWHDLSNVTKIYKQAFGLQLPEIPESIRTGIKLRHDIVHRNGKTPEGQEQSWKKEQIRVLKTSVQLFVTEIEEMLKTLPPDPDVPPAKVEF
jgi:hypothetical protein